jgi:ferri-bacillibactin esterase
MKRGEDARYPAVYVADANLTFDMLKGISYLLHLDGFQRFVLVGIGYPGSSPIAGWVLRARDLTFPGYPRLTVNRPGKGVLVPGSGATDFCGADDFQQFLELELIPLIDKTYPTQPRERAYFGHSVAGGFGLFTLFTKSRLFNRYLVSSPGLTFHGTSSAGISYENHEFLIDRAREFIASGRRLDDVTLYLSVSADEEHEPGLEPWRMASSFHRLTTLLTDRSIPGLQLVTEVFQGESHLTVWPIAFMKGVRTLFPRQA